MASPGLRYLFAAAAATGVSAAAITAGATAGGAPSPVGLLPDLDQQTPTALRIANTSAGGQKAHWVLGFQSAVRNIGAGSLVITGTRMSRKSATMEAHQLIDRADGQRGKVAVKGRLRYAVAPTHQHWHLLRFDRYELRRAGQSHAVVRDQKTGFCLGDRYRVASYEVPAAKAAPTYVGSCGLAQPWKLTVMEGISPGYGDNYLPYLEGQSLPLTGLAAGHYVLVHRTNSDRALYESNYDNDAASVLIDLQWRGTRPVVELLATCPDSASCDSVLQAASASTWSRSVPEGIVAAGYLGPR
ncbi:MAG: lysyl oxidase family protein [Thermoleophilaceae bacterium]